MGDWEALLHFPYGCLSNCKCAHYHICNQEQEGDSHTELGAAKIRGSRRSRGPSFLRRSLGGMR